MKPILVPAILLLAGMPATAHRLDEYLQATLISLEKDRVQLQIRLTPGVAVLPIVLGKVDTDRDGFISQTEQLAYARRVVNDLSLAVEGDRQQLRLVSTKFPNLEEMNEGQGAIQLDLIADIPRRGPTRRLTFENHHENTIAAYLVNSLVPNDPEIRITAQNRNYQQSLYQLDYVQPAGAAPSFLSWLSGANGFAAMVALLLTARLVFLWWQRRGARPFRPSE